MRGRPITQSFRVRVGSLVSWLTLACFLVQGKTEREREKQEKHHRYRERHFVAALCSGRRCKLGGDGPLVVALVTRLYVRREHKPKAGVLAAARLAPVRDFYDAGVQGKIRPSNPRGLHPVPSKG